MTTLALRSLSVTDGVSSILREKLLFIFKEVLPNTSGKKSQEYSTSTTQHQVTSFLAPTVQTNILHLTVSCGGQLSRRGRKQPKLVHLSKLWCAESFCTKTTLETFLLTPYISMHLRAWYQPRGPSRHNLTLCFVRTLCLKGECSSTKKSTGKDRKREISLPVIPLLLPSQEATASFQKYLRDCDASVCSEDNGHSWNHYPDISYDWITV